VGVEDGEVGGDERTEVAMDGHEGTRDKQVRAEHDLTVERTRVFITGDAQIKVGVGNLVAMRAEGGAVRAVTELAGVHPVVVVIVAEFAAGVTGSVFFHAVGVAGVRAAKDSVTGVDCDGVVVEVD